MHSVGLILTVFMFYNIIFLCSESVTLFYHFVGGTPESSSLFSMLRRLRHDLIRTDVSFIRYNPIVSDIVTIETINITSARFVGGGGLTPSGESQPPKFSLTQ